MQTAGIIKGLDQALNAMEKLLNSGEDDYILSVIREYKEHKTLDSHTLNRLGRLLAR